MWMIPCSRSRTLMYGRKMAAIQRCLPIVNLSKRHRWNWKAGITPKHWPPWSRWWPIAVGGSLYSSRYSARYANITARIPAEKLETAMSTAGELCNVVSRSTDVADVTESYADTEARLKTLRLQEERLLEILSKATDLSDVLELESRLSDVRYQIEAYEAALRNYDSLVSYSTLQITLQEVVEYSVINDPPQTLGQRLSDGFADSMRLVKNSAENVLVWLVTYLPLVLLWAVIIAAVVWLVWRAARRAKKNGKQLPRGKKAENGTETAPAASEKKEDAEK